MVSTPKPQPQKRQNVSPQAVTISEGVGAGLKFAPDSSNPEFARGTYELPLQEALENLISSLGYKIMPLAAAYPGVNWQIGHAVAIPRN